jgi:hypothetical protein
MFPNLQRFLILALPEKKHKIRKNIDRNLIWGLDVFGTVLIILVMFIIVRPFFLLWKTKNNKAL